MKLAGCYTALITPFRNGQVDFDALGVIVEQQIAGGVAGLVPVGTTGESPTLTYREHDDVIKFVTEKANKRCQIIAGTGGNSTFEAIHLSKNAAEFGADATLQVTPYYNKPTPEGLYRHFSMVAEESGLPIVLYNVPGRTGREIPVDIVARLSKHKLVAAIKEAGGSVERVNAIKDACPPKSRRWRRPRWTAISRRRWQSIASIIRCIATCSSNRIRFRSRPPWPIWA